MKKFNVSKNWCLKLFNENKSLLSKKFGTREFQFAKSYFSRAKFSNFEAPSKLWFLGGGFSVIVGSACMVTCKAEEEKDEELSVDNVGINAKEVLSEEDINNEGRLKIRNEELKKLLLEQFKKDKDLPSCSFFTELFLSSLEVEVAINQHLSEEDIYSHIMNDPLYGNLVGIYDTLFPGADFLSHLKNHIAEVKKSGG